MRQAIREFSWRGAQHPELYVAEWPLPDPTAVVGLIHGIGEHCRRYDHLAEYFRDNNIACLGYDRRGHGRSGGKKGFAPRYRDYLEEIELLRRECTQRYPDQPVLLYGHSMGGQLLLNYLIDFRPELTATIVSAPHIQLPFKPNPLQVGMGKLMRRIKPDFTLPNDLDLQLLSRDPAVVQRYQDDPLVHNQLSAQTGIDLLEAAEKLDRFRGELSTPTLLLHGTADGITSHPASKAFAARNATWVEFREWPEYYHELHNEPTWREVAAYCVDWIAGQLN